MKKVFSILAVVALMAAPACAEDGQINKNTLERLGLSGAQVLTDSEGMEIRGQARGSAMAMGMSIVTGLIIDPATKSFVFGADANGAVANSAGRNPNRARTRTSSSLGLQLDVTTGNSTFSGLLLGGAGGRAFAAAP